MILRNLATVAYGQHAYAALREITPRLQRQYDQADE
jgi:hypothetical protein